MGEPLPEPLAAPATAGDHEHSDVQIRPLMIFLGVLAASLVLVSIALVALFNLFESGAERRDPALPPLAQDNAGPAGPTLQVSPREDLQQFRDREARVLNSTEWVNDQVGIVRIPIDRAIALTVERGLPKWPAADVTASPVPAAAERPPSPAPAESPLGAGPSTSPEGGAQR